MPGKKQENIKDLDTGWTLYYAKKLLTMLLYINHPFLYINWGMTISENKIEMDYYGSLIAMINDVLLAV